MARRLRERGRLAAALVLIPLVALIASVAGYVSRPSESAHTSDLVPLVATRAVQHRTVTAAVTSTATPEATASAMPMSAATAPAAVRVAPVVPGQSAAVISRGDTERKFIALSFDAGADVGYTTQILDVLRDRRVSVSFGMTGQWAEAHPELVRRMADEGHDFINHTYDHDSFTGVSTGRGPMSSAGRARELERAEEIVRGITGRDMNPYFRPPYGDYDSSVNADVGALGYTYNVLWTLDSLGWRGISVGAIVERCISNASPGAIYIFHVGSQSQDGVALPAILDGLRQQGYELGSVRQLGF